jgi:arylsulfatase A-like enzyme
MSMLLLGLALGCGSWGRGAQVGPPNILLVSLDTVRADALGVYGNPRPTTPTLDRLAAGGTVFNAAFSQSNESAYSHGALFTGRHASELALPVYEQWALPPSAITVGEVLQVYGYETAAFVAGGHVTEGFGFNQGWDHFRDFSGFQSLFDTGPLALDWLRGLDGKKPWMAFLHSYDAHRPYLKPGPFDHLYSGEEVPELGELIADDPGISERVYDGHVYPDQRPKRFLHGPSGQMVMAPNTYRLLAWASKRKEGIALSQADIRHVRDHYDACVSYADLQLGLFLARAEAGGFMDNTLVIIVSDHGEDLLDHGFMNHRTGLYDSNIKVPMILAGPGVPRGLRHGGLVEALDVLPTMLAAAGAETPAGVRGRDLLALVAGQAPAKQTLFAEGVMGMVSARTATHKLIHHDNALAAEDHLAVLASAPLTPRHFALYDLVADPGEQQDRLADPTEADLALASALRVDLLVWRQGLDSGTHRLDPATLDPETLKQLRDKGYWAAEADP